MSTDDTEGAAAPAPTDHGWRRVHPLTPFLRSWQIVVVMIFIVGQNVGGSVLGGGGVGDALPGDLGRSGLIAAAIAFVVLLVATLLAALSWRFTRFRVTDDALELHQGVLSRRQRQAPLDRLQAVDIVQPLVARVLGLSRLTLEVAGGGDSKIELAYLSDSQARTLRIHLLAAAAGLRSDTPAPSHFDDEAAEQSVITVSVQRLVGSILLSSVMISVAVTLAALVVVSIVLGNPGLIALAVPFLFGSVTMIWNRLTGGFGFRVASAADGVRVRHGLLEQRTQTVPPGRVQAVRLSQPWCWRVAGWWSVEVNVAGYGSGSGNDGTVHTSTLLPVGSRDHAVAVLAFVLPDLGVAESPGAVVDAALTGTREAGGFTAAPPRARWADPIGWRRRGYRVTDTALLLRRGVFHRQVDVVPHPRTQSCAVRQGPLQRRLGLASFELHSTPGPIAPTVDHLASEVAAALLDAQSARARTARRAARDRWPAHVRATTYTSGTSDVRDVRDVRDDGLWPPPAH